MKVLASQTIRRSGKSPSFFDFSRIDVDDRDLGSSCKLGSIEAVIEKSNRVPIANKKSAFCIVNWRPEARAVPGRPKKSG